MKKISTFRLIGFLVLLLLIYAATEYFSNTERSSSFKEELVTIDTDKVSRVEILKESQTTILEKIDDQWTVSTDLGESYQADPDRAMSMLTSLLSIKPARIASRNPEKWQEFQVDSTGTQVRVFEGSENTLDIVLGRFGMQGQQQFYTFVRLSDDDNVYVAENFMSYSVSTDEQSYRVQTVTTFSRDSINAIRLIYPADSSFSLVKSIDGNWTSINFQPDSLKTAQYISQLSNLRSNKFENTTNVSGFSPLYKAEIEIPGETIVLQAFPKTDSTFVITTSQNAEGKFEDPSLFDKIFASKSSLISDNQPDSQE